MRLFHTRLVRFDGVDDVLFDRLDFFRRKVAAENVNLCGTDKRTVALRNYLNTLRRAVRTLIKLTGKVFDRKHITAARVEFVARFVYLRFGKHGVRNFAEKFGGDEFGVVAVDNAHAGTIFHAEYARRLRFERVRFGAITFSFFDENSVNHIYSFALIAFAPISRR